MRFAPLACLLAAGLALVCEAAPVPKAGPPRVLVTASNRDGNWEIYLVVPGAAGGEVKNLTENKALDIEPVWSPDGRRIAFVSTRDGGKDIWTMNPDGTDVKQITKKSGGCITPRWSPDGKHIAFVSPGLSPKDAVYVVEVASGKTTKVTDDPLPCRLPAWSPDGKKIAYTTTSGRWYGYVVNADGTGNEKISGNQGAADLAWSPDGKQLAFTDSREAPGWRLFTMASDGKNAKLLNKNGNTYGNVYPRWSPDASLISYGEMVNGVPQIGVVGADGTGAKVITEKHTHLYSRWSPDGKSISFNRIETGKPPVLVVSDPDGRNAKDLLSGVAPAAAEWKPK